tara:strand:- start:970 stop:2772 length:1803 start_codon:yes stop_codon:yes gene_type:complete
MLKFENLFCSPDLSFWNELTINKLNTYKLNENYIPIKGVLNKSILKLNKNSFNISNNNNNNKNNKNFINGHLKIINTIEDFKLINKKKLLNNLLLTHWKNITFHWEFNIFILLVYADLKYNKFIYWIGYPTFKTHNITYKKQEITEGILHIFNKHHLSKSLTPYFTIINPSTSAVLPFNKRNLLQKNIIIFIKNLTTNNNNPTWLLRNFLFYLQQLHITQINLLLFNSESNSNSNSNFLQVYLPSINIDLNIVTTIGWEKNHSKFKPKTVDLSSVQFENNINLKLMKWRMLPSLHIPTLNSTKCLLIGAGTLGCSISRNLISWGIKHITFLDNGTVSTSNPMRQSLYLHKHIGKPKATTASLQLKEILPSINSNGFISCIPMPGHIITDKNKTIKNINLLIQLIQSHDAVFILTDTRESRWLPILLSKIYNKLTINVAIGFDSFLIIRSQENLGCYFCNDVVAPRNSSHKLTLDQQCTVTKPGVATIASSLAVELFISLIQQKYNNKNNLIKSDTFQNNFNKSNISLIPHQIRGNISNYKYYLPTSPPFKHCTACSSIIKQEFNKHKHNFIIKVCNNPGYLEDLSGLTEFHKQTELIDFI